MTNSTTAQQVTDLTAHDASPVLAQHGYASIDDARADMIGFGCFGCGSIARVTATSEAVRQMQVALIDWDCCGDTFEL